jgi:hypothetical protein
VATSLLSTISIRSIATMSRQLDNEAPTIFAPSAPATSARRKSGKALLWEDRGGEFMSFEDDQEDEGKGSGNGSGSDEVDMSKEGKEEIDAEEVFGELSHSGIES